MSRVLRVLSVVCILVVLPIQPAKACSCFYGDPRDRFQEAEGAFIGTFVESHPVEPNPSSSGADTIYTFLLDEELKGEIGEPGGTVEVHAPLSGASCGIEATPGEQYGLYLEVRASDGKWTSSLCSQVSPETMREGASPLPAPTSEGPVRLVAGGSFGDMQTMVLDAQGRTVGYGGGDQDVTQVAGCRGSARILEIARTWPEPPILFVRDLSSLEVVDTVELPFGKGKRFTRNLSITGLRCLSEDGRRSVVFATNWGEPEAKSALLRIDGDDVEVLNEGTARSATIDDDHAYLQQGRWGRRLTSVSLRNGSERFVARLPKVFSGELALSPDGSTLAGIAYPQWSDADEKAARLYTVEPATGRMRMESLGTGERDAHVLWLSDSRIVMFVAYPDASRVFDVRLRERNRFGRWEAHQTVIVDDTAYGIDWEGRLLKVELPNGTPEVARRLPSPVVYDLATVGG